MSDATMFSVVPHPEFYKGWVIQPNLDGSFGVYPRTDTSRNVGTEFPSSEAAFNYVDEEAARGV